MGNLSNELIFEPVTMQMDELIDEQFANMAIFYLDIGDYLEGEFAEELSEKEKLPANNYSQIEPFYDIEDAPDVFDIYSLLSLIGVSDKHARLKNSIKFGHPSISILKNEMWERLNNRPCKWE